MLRKNVIGKENVPYGQEKCETALQYGDVLKGRSEMQRDDVSTICEEYNYHRGGALPPFVHRWAAWRGTKNTQVKNTHSNEIVRCMSTERKPPLRRDIFE